MALFVILVDIFLKYSCDNLTASQELGAHAITLNAYMGYDTVKPFLGDPSRGVFVLCKVGGNKEQTMYNSNPKIYKLVLPA